MTIANSQVGRLVLTVRVNDAANSEAIVIRAFDEHGAPVNVFVELASNLSACRCGADTRRARLRVIAPKTLRITRVPCSEVPGAEGQP